jgi:hypothetical protein
MTHSDTTQGQDMPAAHSCENELAGRPAGLAELRGAFRGLDLAAELAAGRAEDAAASGSR